MNPVRVHNTAHPLPQSLRDFAQAPVPSRKPVGLWWAELDAWRSLIGAGTRPALRSRRAGAFDYQLDLPSDFRLLKIDDFEDVLRFSRRYGRPMPHAAQGFFWQRTEKMRYDPDQDQDLHTRGRGRAFLIDWAEVATDYDGIEIRMPVGSMRGDRPWMEWLDQDWDLPSGCAWRCRGIAAELSGPDHGPIGP